MGEIHEMWCVLKSLNLPIGLGSGINLSKSTHNKFITSNKTSNQISMNSNHHDNSKECTIIHVWSKYLFILQTKDMIKYLLKINSS